MAAEAIVSWIATNPEKALSIAGTGLSVLDRLLGSNPAAEMADVLIQDQFDRYNELKREASGNFTPARIQDIRQSRQGRLNRLAAGLGQRGLGSSEAGADFLQQAQEAPFLEAQRAAAQMLPAQRKFALDLAREFAGSESIGKILGSLAKNLAYLNYLEGKPDPDVDGALGTLAEALEFTAKEDLKGSLKGYA